MKSRERVKSTEIALKSKTTPTKKVLTPIITHSVSVLHGTVSKKGTRGQKEPAIMVPRTTDSLGPFQGLVQWERLNGNRRFIRSTTAQLRHRDLFAVQLDSLCVGLIRATLDSLSAGEPLSDNAVTTDIGFLSGLNKILP